MPSNGRARTTATVDEGGTRVSLVFAGHEVDLRRQELRRAGQIIHVEPQVFDLLVHLVRNRDRVVSKDENFDGLVCHGEPALF
jgi:DNA-binding response OmpR family regulator